jgi:hypothetical protein
MYRLRLPFGVVATTIAILLSLFTRSSLVRGDDLSTFQCTANDVTIMGAGQIIDEPCNCQSTFSATVEFTVQNTAASDRGCITLHLNDSTDIILQGSIAGKTTQTMTGSIPNFPCGAGLVCFGTDGPARGNRCDPGACSTVSWTVPGQDACPPDRQISSKCRHQRICIQGRAPAPVLTCLSGCTGCGTTSGTLRLCSTATDVVPSNYQLTETGGGTTYTATSLSNGCATFSNVPAGSYTGSVTEGGTCTKTSNVVSVTASPNPSAPSVVATQDCSGVVTLTATATGTVAVDHYEWTGSCASVTLNVCTFTPSFSTSCRTPACARAVTSDGCKSPQVCPNFKQCSTLILC